MNTYYDGPALEDRVLTALRAAGRGEIPLDSDALAALDEFHAVGRAGTLALAKLAGVGVGERVLDLGAGIGGPSRVLARYFGAHVTALEPTARFAALARVLTERCALDDRVRVVRGDGREIPAADASFDLVWTQAVWQSVEDKAKLAAEINRVLRPGGRLALLEVAGDGAALEYPVPWADGPGESFVISTALLGEVLEAAGLGLEDWSIGADVQAAVLAATQDNARMAAGLPGVGLDLLMPDYAARMAGLAANVEAGRIELVLALARKART
jgi:SAM-dependent methyltransferase